MNTTKNIWLGGAKWTVTDQQFQDLHAGPTPENPQGRPEAMSEAAAIMYLQDAGVIPEDFVPAVQGGNDAVVRDLKKKVDALIKELAKLKADKNK